MRIRPALRESFRQQLGISTSEIVDFVSAIVVQGSHTSASVIGIQAQTPDGKPINQTCFLRARVCNLHGSILATTIGGTNSGYSVAPTLTISAPPPGGVQATAHTTLSSGAIVVVVDNPGAGYTVAPTITVSAGTATVTCTINSTLGNATNATIAATSGDALASLSLTAAGSGYTTATVSFSGGSGAGAAATATIGANGAIIRLTLTNQGEGYTSAPTVTITGDGSGATATAALEPSPTTLVETYTANKDLAFQSDPSGLFLITLTDATVETVQLYLGASGVGGRLGNYNRVLNVVHA